MEMLLLKSLGYLILIQLPAWLILQLLPGKISRFLKTEIWADPD